MSVCTDIAKRRSMCRICGTYILKGEKRVLFFHQHPWKSLPNGRGYKNQKYFMHHDCVARVLHPEKQACGMCGKRRKTTRCWMRLPPTEGQQFGASPLQVLEVCGSCRLTMFNCQYCGGLFPFSLLSPVMQEEPDEEVSFGGIAVRFRRTEVGDLVCHFCAQSHDIPTRWIVEQWAGQLAETRGFLESGGLQLAS